MGAPWPIRPFPSSAPGIISERQAFAGFASPGVAAYAALFILSEAFAEVKVLDALMPRGRGEGRGWKGRGKMGRDLGKVGDPGDGMKHDGLKMVSLI